MIDGSLNKSKPGKPSISRRKFLLQSGGIALGTMLIGAEAFGREVLFPEVETVQVTMPKLEGRLRLVQVSDLHYHKSYTPCKKLAEKIVSLKPDVVAVTGDVISNRDGLDQLKQLVSSISAPVYTVPGNWETYLRWTSAEQKDFYNRSGGEFLLNCHTHIPLAGGVNIVGVDDPFTGLDDLDRAVKGIDISKPSILLAHAPVIAQQAVRRKIDLTLCGHTHGGQIRLPLIGALFVPHGSNGFQMGMYDVDGMKLYVNRGIGTCLLPIRFLCPPEITLFLIQGDS